MSWSLIADVVVAVLLIATLIYVRRFSVRLEAIRAGRAEFEKLIADLTKSTDQAANHLHQFKATAELTGGDLQARIERAQGLAAAFGRIGDDLKLLTGRAEDAANRLEAAIGRTRPNAAANAPAPAPAAAIAAEQIVEDDDNRRVANLSALSGMR
ncbi:MAG: DUF6468 domain-containing protein [Dongiaceae bacterium]